MKKKFIIAGIIAIALIFIVLILIVVLSNATKTEVRVMNNIVTSSQPTEQNTVENKTNSIRTSNISGEIEMYDLEEGGTIPIPPTFEYVEGELDTGAVIQDKDGNQFVWVPVNNFEIYSNRFLFDHNGDLDNDVLAEKLEDIDDYDSSYDDSVRNYGGFYLARYEAGKESGNEYPVSKEGAMPWTTITWKQAKDLAYNMYGQNDCLQTDLVNSYAWDSTCLWLAECGYDIDNSTDYGNYQNGIQGIGATVECGGNTRWVTNNIYDMAGNVWEFSTEIEMLSVDGNYETIHFGRGGGFWNNGDEYPISSRYPSDGDGANIAVGFRVVLYLK